MTYSPFRKAMHYATRRMLEGGEYNTVEDINSGGCFEWATEVFSMAEHTQIHGHSHSGGYHAFIARHGKFYDSETPQGVERWQNLPYFKRCRALRSVI